MSINLMATNGSTMPPTPYISMFLRNKTVAPAGLKRTPRNASGIKAGTVSYTHLDVYKRQTTHCANPALAFSAGAAPWTH